MVCQQMRLEGRLQPLARFLSSDSRIEPVFAGSPRVMKRRCTIPTSLYRRREELRAVARISHVFLCERFPYLILVAHLTRSCCCPVKLDDSVSRVEDRKSVV